MTAYPENSVIKQYKERDGQYPIMDGNPRSTEAMLQIEPLSTEHISQMAELEKLCFPDPWSENLFFDLLSNPLAVYFVALINGKVIGYAGMYHILSEGQIMNVATHPEHRRKGVAEKLFGELLEYAEDNDIEEMSLEVRSENLSAIALYEKLGFEKVGIRKNYYSSPHDDAVLMSLEL